MDIEKILTLVAIVVYGLVNLVLSVVRTLKTSRISSEVKSVIPSFDKDSVLQPSDDGQHSSVDQLSGDEGDSSVSSLVELINKIYGNK